MQPAILASSYRIWVLAILRFNCSLALHIEREKAAQVLLFMSSLQDTSGLANIRNHQQSPARDADRIIQQEEKRETHAHIYIFFLEMLTNTGKVIFKVTVFLKP